MKNIYKIILDSTDEVYIKSKKIAGAVRTLKTLEEYKWAYKIEIFLEGDLVAYKTNNKSFIIF